MVRDTRVLQQRGEHAGYVHLHVIHRVLGRTRTPRCRAGLRRCSVDGAELVHRYRTAIALPIRQALTVLKRSLRDSAAIVRRLQVLSTVLRPGTRSVRCQDGKVCEAPYFDEADQEKNQEGRGDCKLDDAAAALRADEAFHSASTARFTSDCPSDGPGSVNVMPASR